MKKEEDIYKNIMNFKCTNVFQSPLFLKKEKLLQPDVQFSTKTIRSNPIAYNKTIPTYPGLEFN